MTDDDRCIHELAPGTCSICSGRETTIVKKEPHLSTCKDCEAPIVWVWSEKGKAMPIDAAPGGDPDKARFRKERTEQVGEVLRGIVHYVRNSELEDNVRPLYCCHFDTCTRRPKGDK